MTAATFSPRPRALGLPTIGLVAALGVAGLIHCLLMPDHLAESTLFGLGFLGAAVAQLGLAALAVLRPSRMVYATVIAVSVVLIGLYAFNVAVGLPFHEGTAAHESDGHASASATADEHGGEHEAGEHAHDEGIADEDGDDHEEGGLALGAGEPVDGWGATTQVAQLSAIGFAAFLLRRRDPEPGSV